MGNKTHLRWLLAAFGMIELLVMWVIESYFQIWKL